MSIAIRKLDVKPGDLLILRITEDDKAWDDRFRRWAQKVAGEVSNLVKGAKVLFLDPHVSLDHFPAEKVREFAGLASPDEMTRLLVDLLRIGMQLEVVEGHLLYKSRQFLSADIRQRLRDHEGELVALLQAKPTPMPCPAVTASA